MTENLTRAYQKIFAKNAGAQGKTVFGSTAQGNTQYTTDISAMQSEAYENGFADAVVSKKAPVLQDFNTVENITTRQLAYLFQKGIPEWNSETSYFKGNIVLNIESDIPVLYYSLIDNNLNNQVSDTESWKKVLLDINIANKANISLDNLDATGQALFTNKANISLDNINSTANETITNLAAPSTRYIEIALTPNTEFNYTCPANGYITIGAESSASNGGAVQVLNKTNGLGNQGTRNGLAYIGCGIPVAKGDIVELYYYNCNSYYARFIYSIGN